MFSTSIDVEAAILAGLGSDARKEARNRALTWAERLPQPPDEGIWLSLLVKAADDLFAFCSGGPLVELGPAAVVDENDPDDSADTVEAMCSLSASEAAEVRTSVGWAALPPGGFIIRDVRGLSMGWSGSAWVEDSRPVTAGVPDANAWAVLTSADSYANHHKVFRGYGEAERVNPGRFVRVRPVRVRPGAEGFLELVAACGRLGGYVARAIPNRKPAALMRRTLRAEAFEGAELHSGGTRDGQWKRDRDGGAWLAPHPIGRRLVVFDFDEIAGPDWLGWEGPADDAEAARVVEWLRETQLGGALAGARCAYRWSSSAGVDTASNPGGWSLLKLHVAFWLDRAVCDQSLAEWARGIGADPAVCRSVQPLFLAAPVFDGRPDPVAEKGLNRCGVVDGTTDVHAPELLLNGPAFRAQAQRIADAEALLVDVNRLVGALRCDADGLPAVEGRVRGYVTAAIRNGADRLASTGSGARHDTALLEATKLAELAVCVGMVGDVERCLLAAWRACAGVRADGPKAIRLGIETGRGRALALDEIYARLR